MKKKIDSVIAKLDYATAATIPTSDTSTLYVIRITTPADNRSSFLGIDVHQSGKDFDGLYNAKSLSSIQLYYAKHALAQKDSILVWGIDKHPIKGWVKRDDNKIHNLRGEGKSPTATSNSGDSSTSTIRVKENYIQDPDEEPCTLWYWIEYDPETGQVYNSTYLYSTGNCDGNSGGGTSGTTTQTIACGGLSLDDVNAAFNNATFDASVDGATLNEGASYVDPGDNRQYKPVTTSFELQKVDLGWTIGSVTYSAYFAGVEFRPTPNTGAWLWDSFSFSSVAISDEHLLYCFAATVESQSGSVSRRDDYTMDASVSYTGKVHVNFPLQSLYKERTFSTNKTHSFIAQ